MRKTLCVTAVALALAAATAARADDKTETRAVIDKAIQARGGEEKLAKVKAVTFKGKGKFYGMGEGIDYTGEWTIQPPDKLRFQIDSEANGMKFTFLWVFDGKKGWMKVGDNTMELSEEDIAEAKEDLYAGRVEMLLPLVKDKGFELSPLGEVKVEDQVAVGVRVAHKGHRDINLYFDKKTGLLLKSERTVKDQMMGGKERMQETLHSDYKDVGGVQHAMKAVIKRDGEKYVESEVSDFQTRDQIDDSAFAKP
jgi:outer membrane lipoprotein-sorting protein